MAQTNQQTDQQTPQPEQQVQDNTQQQPVAEQQPVQQSVEEQVEEKPKVINYLGNEYELDNYIKQLQYNIGSYISYLKLDKDQSRILRDSFNMFIGKLRAGEVAIDDTGAWVDYAGEMANTKKGFDPWGLVVRLANMGLSNMTPYQAPEPEKTPVLPEFAFNSGKGYLFSGEDPLLAPAFSGLSWDEQKNILKSFFAIDPADITKSSIYTQWGKTYSSPFDQKDIQDTITGINTELSKDTTEPSGMLKYYLSRLGYNTASIWPKSTTDTDSQTSQQTNTGSVNGSSTQPTSTTSTQTNTSQSNNTFSTFDQWIEYNTRGTDYDTPILTFTPSDNKAVTLIVKDGVDKNNLIGQYSTFIYNILSLNTEQVNNFLNKFFTGTNNIPTTWSKERARAAIFQAVTQAINKKYPNEFITNNNGVNYYNLMASGNYFLLGIQNNKLKKFKWDSTQYGKDKIQWRYNNSTSKKKKGGTIVKAQQGITWQGILNRNNLGVENTKFYNLAYNYDLTDPSSSEYTTEGSTSDQSPIDNGGTPQDQVTPPQDNGGTPQGQGTPPPVRTTPNGFYTTEIEFTGNLEDLSNLGVKQFTDQDDWETWRNERIKEGDVIFWKDGKYYSIPGSTAYTFRDTLKNYYSGSTVVANENQVPSEGNAKWMSSLLSSLNALNKGLFTSLNNDANARLLKENTLPVLQTPQTYTYSPLTTNFSTQQLQRQQALNAERQQQLGADQQSDITLGLNARKSATLDRLNNEQAILAATDSQLKTDMATNVSDQNKYFQNLSELTNNNRKSIYDAQLQRASIDATNRTKNTENVWGGVFDTVGNNLQSLFTDKIQRQENIIREYWRRRGNDYIQQVWNAWHTKNKGTYNDFLNSSEYADAQSEVNSMLRQQEDYVPSASAYSWRTKKQGGRLTYSILNKLRR